MRNSNYSIGLLQKRLLVFLLLITFLFCALILRVGIIQMINGPKLQVRATDQWTRDVPLKAERGFVTDVCGAVLAKSIPTYDIYVRHKNVENPLELAKMLSEKLGLEFEKTYSKIQDNTISEIAIKLQVEQELTKSILNTKLAGIVVSENFQRYYPYGDLLTQVLGFTTSDGIGQFGLESYYNDYLKGINGTLLTQSDVKGNELKNTIDYYLPSQKGLNINTTLNHKIQQLLESALMQCVEEQKANKAMGIVIKPKTGEIVAMSCKPSFDLNNVPRNDVETLLANSKNMLITDIYEPGSTFKILTSAISLDEGVVKIEDSFYDPGYRIVSGEKIKCWKLTGHGQQNFQDGFCNSCNSVFMDMALRLGLDKFYERAKSFGLTEKTGIDFQGEVTGIMMQKNLVKSVDLARMGFGQAIAVSPIQLAMALCTTINGGELLVPYLVKSITNDEGKVVAESTKMVKRRVIKSETSAIIREFLEDAVGRPLGKYTFIPGYSVGGKTGTTQKYAEGKIAGTYIASFFGIYPCDDPEYAILFIADEPKAGSYYGSIVATPYAKKVIEGIIELNGDLPKVEGVKIGKIQMPNLIGLSLTEAVKILAGSNLQYEIAGEGGKIVSQFPLDNIEINQNQIVQITLG